jgi:S-adenosylmethionine:tRNA ribosyltransferase-isomerase
MNLSDFDFDLPQDRIALHPAERREEARLLCLRPRTEALEHRVFHELPKLLRAGDVLVLNETRVRLGRIRGRRPSGGRVEILILAPHPEGGWQAMVKPGRRLRPGEVVATSSGQVEILDELPDGRRRVRLRGPGGEDVGPDALGEPALPPYIRRDPEPADRDRYQTVYATEVGAVAAPTAGLHFTEPLLDELARAGVGLARVVLHVGAGTFLPVTTDDVDAHAMEPEFYRYPEEAAGIIEHARARGGRIIAVGTTSARVLETVGTAAAPGEGWTDLFIRPPYRFRAVDGLITNFHLPGSTLIMLVAALAGRERILAAYATARDEGYRFYSYGDAMLIL